MYGHEWDSSCTDGLFNDSCLRVGMAARLSLHLDAGSGSTLDDAGHLLSGVWAHHGKRGDIDGEVVWLNPVDLVERITGERDAAGSAPADIAQTCL